MATTNGKMEPPASARTSLGGIAWEREFRLWAGLILFTFVTLHLINHALGVFGIATMEVMQHWRVAFWRSWPGFIALYGAAIVHVSLALKRIALRRTWRMPVEEAVQIALGLTIPLLVVEHALGTHYAAVKLGVNDSYPAVLTRLWEGKPVMQSVLILVAWFHGVIGIHYVFRSRPWFHRVRDAGMVVAFLLPILSIAGFAAAGREAVARNVPEAARTPQQIADFEVVAQTANMIMYSILGLLVAFILGRALLRRLRRTIPVRYVGHGQIDVKPGSTLLEASRASRIPHPSQCGGRGRCSTCRVLVLSGQESLPEPKPVERRLLTKISAPASVRLACQIRPTSPLTVQVLLPVVARASNLDWEEETYKWGVDRDVTILFVDVRAFTTLSQKQLPHDTVLLVNRFISEITQTVDAHDGRVGMYLSDGVMAIFGLGGQRGMGSRAAIKAGLDMLKVTQALNEELGSALPMPLRVGIGIHSGPAVIARVGDTERGYMMTALGETVTIASRLEAATKELVADMVVSDVTMKASGLTLGGAMQREVQLRSREQPLKVYAMNEAIPSEAAA